MSAAQGSPVVVVGAGAIGGTIAHGLVSAGRDVVLVDTDAEHVAAIKEHGIRIERPDGTLDVSPPVTALMPEEFAGAPIGLALLATKSQHTETAAAWLAARLAADGTVLSCQNGDTLEAAARHLGSGRLLAAMVEVAADVVAPGVIRDGAAGGLTIGEQSGGPTPRARALAALLGVSVPTTVSANVRGLLWAKRGMAMMLTASAFEDAPTAQVIDAHPEVMAALAREVHAVAVARGITPEPFDGYDAAAFTTGSDEEVRAAVATLAATIATFRKKRSGVFRDIVVRRRRTEAGHDIAALLGDAGRLGVEVPACALLARILGELEDGERPVAARNLTEMRDALDRHSAPDPAR